jgi:hypothetical protein
LDNAVICQGFDGLLWLFVSAVTLHMIEELIWLPAWSQAAGRWHEPVGRRPFAFATAVMLLFLYIISYLATNAAPESGSIYLVCGLALVMLINIFWPHLGATIAQRRYAPGLATSLLFILPTASLLLWRAFEDNAISMPRYGVVAAGILLGTAVIWPALLRIGKRLPGN